MRGLHRWYGPLRIRRYTPYHLVKLDMPCIKLITIITTHLYRISASTELPYWILAVLRIRRSKQILRVLTVGE